MPEAQTLEAAPAVDDGKITCHIDGARVHSVQAYINEFHSGTWTIERYKQEFPDQPLLSDFAKRALEKRRAERTAQQPATSGMALATAAVTEQRRPMHEVFDLGPSAKAAFTAAGNPIMVSTLQGCETELQPYLADLDRNYVFNIELLKLVIAGLQLNYPTYVWGMHGTGKTTLLEQAACRTGRPFVRVQHTINTEEAHILGQYVVRDGATIFQLGPLPTAMLFGGVYCADEYDFAMPSVLAVYQPVLEGKHLIIKEAPPEFRVIRPHPNFRFVATGNTNGGGDETGLYQGTLIQNAANYSRFKITFEMPYMEESLEVAVVSAQCGIDKAPARKIVQFAKLVREAFTDGKLANTISPRELISAGGIGIAFGADYQLGLRTAFANRLSRVDRQVAEQLLTRVFGA